MKPSVNPGLGLLCEATGWEVEGASSVCAHVSALWCKGGGAPTTRLNKANCGIPHILTAGPSFLPLFSSRRLRPQRMSSEGGAPSDDGSWQGL